MKDWDDGELAIRRLFIFSIFLMYKARINTHLNGYITITDHVGERTLENRGWDDEISLYTPKSTEVYDDDDDVYLCLTKDVNTSIKFCSQAYFFRLEVF